jgi:NAD(P)-dependent dehydrogenase (short-subunit alcohol dehydrogenase family)
MTPSLEGKVVIVTGGGQGIGRVYARRIAGEGAVAVVADVADTAPAVAEIEEAGGTVIGIPTDVTSPESTREMATKAVERFGRIDALVNNAGIYAALTPKPFEDISYDEWNKVIAVNLGGPFNATQAVVPHLRRNGGGRIVNVSSGTPFKGTPMFLHYVSSKGAILAFTKSLAKELGRDHILVNCVAPGFTLSDTVQANEIQMRNFRDVSVSARTLQRDQLPEDIAGTVVFLLGDDSAFITGQTIVVDGGAYFH